MKALVVDKETNKVLCEMEHVPSHGEPITIKSGVAYNPLYGSNTLISKHYTVSRREWCVEKPEVCNQLQSQTTAIIYVAAA